MSEQTTTEDSRFNTVTWWEIPATDLEEAKTFYTAVLGWTYQPFAEAYVGIFNGSDMIGGLFEESDTPVQEGIRIYVYVADLEGVLRTVEANGGKTRTPRQEVGGDMGWWASFTAPDGRLIGLSTQTPAVDK